MPPTETTAPTLCGTCQWWDHDYAEKTEKKIIEDIDRANIKRRKAGERPYRHLSWHRIAPCKWGENLPWWLSALRGDRFTNEAGVTKDGCLAWKTRQ